LTVQILLSTHNGAAYLQPLMQSLLAQDYAQLAILVRDDGSSDDTIPLLQDYAGIHPHITVVYGANIGFAQSFLRLLELSSPTADYIAFCDQDDVWQPDKVSRAVQVLKQCRHDIPALYSSRLAVVDQDLNPLGWSRILTKTLAFQNALVECPIAGCTMLINQAARRVLLRAIPQNINAHDWWTYLVVSAFGMAYFDKEARVLYRQHASNVIGIRLGSIKRLRFKMRRFWRIGKLQLVMRQAEEFHRLYGAALPSDERRALERFLGSRRKRFVGRLGYACSCEVYRQSVFDNLVLKALISLNRL
jgi:glycosyltransferase involved in cell wall biosynthesis